MSSEVGDHLTDREKRYLRRNRRYNYTDDREDKSKSPLSGEDEENEYSKLLLQTMQDIVR